MDLRSHYPYWLLKHGIVKTYPSVRDSFSTDVLVMGSGISGALVAHYLHREGMNVTVIDRRHAGQGSTAASTGILQYEIDMPLHRLINLVGEKHAVASYEMCLRAIDVLWRIARRYKHVEFTSKPSLQFASAKKHVHALEQEYLVRRQFGISNVQWLDESDVQQRFGFHAPAALLSPDGAEMDAYGLTHALLSSGSLGGVQVFDRTEAVAIVHHKRSVTVHLKSGKHITARKLVIACGYESQNYLPKKIEKQYSTYAVVSEPLDKAKLWYRNSMIWETAVPYRYIRMTKDNRILIGGMDDKFYNPERRDRQLPGKAKRLADAFTRLFPDIPFIADFQWAGTFCNTRDGLPYIGTVPRRPHTYFALGFGGNGITFSLIAAEIIRDALVGRKHPGAPVFSFERAGASL